MAFRAFAAREHLVYAWIDLEDADDVDVLLASMGVHYLDTPVVVTPTAVLRHPSPGEFAEHLGLTFHAPPGYTFDLVVVGSGPVRPGRRGLRHVRGTRHGVTRCRSPPVGKQAPVRGSRTTWAFPNGISGEELASRAAIQAQRLGARLNAPCKVAGLRSGHGFHVVVLADGSEVPTKTVIVASGARYQRLSHRRPRPLRRRRRVLRGDGSRGADLRRLRPMVVGGGNSAGQASIYLAQQGSRVSLAVGSPTRPTSVNR